MYFLGPFVKVVSEKTVYYWFVFCQLLIVSINRKQMILEITLKKKKKKVTFVPFEIVDAFIMGGRTSFSANKLSIEEVNMYTSSSTICNDTR